MSFEVVAEGLEEATVSVRAKGSAKGVLDVEGEGVNGVDRPGKWIEVDVGCFEGETASVYISGADGVAEVAALHADNNDSSGIFAITITTANLNLIY